MKEITFWDSERQRKYLLTEGEDGKPKKERISQKEKERRPRIVKEELKSYNNFVSLLMEALFPEGWRTGLRYFEASCERWGFTVSLSYCMPLPGDWISLPMKLERALNESYKLKAMNIYKESDGLFLNFDLTTK